MLKSSEDGIFCTLLGINFALDGMFCSLFDFLLLIEETVTLQILFEYAEMGKVKYIWPCGNTIIWIFLTTVALVILIAQTELREEGTIVLIISVVSQCLLNHELLSLFRVCKIGVEKEIGYLWKHMLYQPLRNSSATLNLLELLVSTIFYMWKWEGQWVYSPLPNMLNVDSCQGWIHKSSGVENWRSIRI